MSTFFRLFIASILVLVGLFSCSKAPLRKTALQPTSKNTLKISINRDPATLDPRKGGDVVSSSLHFLLFDGLTRLSENGERILSGASGYDISLDGCTYTFYLKDANWSNGAPITAHDYAYSWNKILDPEFPAPNAHLLYPIKNALRRKKGLASQEEVGIKAPSDRKLVVTLEKPTPYFLDLLAFCVFFPVSKQLDQSYPEWNHRELHNFTSNGPFVIKEWKPHNGIILKKNPNYWDVENTSLDGIHLALVSNENTALQLFEKGELDIISTSVAALPVEAIENLQKKGLLHINKTAGSKICSFNTQSKPFCNRNIRLAFSLALNRNEIVDNITLLGEQVATGAIPPALKNGRTRHFFSDGDSSAAKAHLKLGLEELGIDKSELNNLTYLYSVTEGNRLVAQAVQQQWAKELGVEISLQGMDHKILLDRLKNRNYDLADAMWMAQFFDQISILERFAYKDNPKNYSSWECEHYIRLLTSSFNETDPEKRLAKLEDAEEYFIKQMPIAPLYHINYAYLINPRVSAIHFNAMGFLLFEKTTLNHK